MRLQKDNCPCGPTAALNALECLGAGGVSGRVMASRCATDESGDTDEKGILRGLGASGCKTEVVAAANKDEAFSVLLAVLHDGFPVILSVDNRQHWVVATGRLGARICVFDSTRTKKNLRRNGAYVLSRRQLFNRWTKDENGRYYGIIVRQSRAAAP